MNFFLVNQYSGNKGDRAVLFAMCKMLKSLYFDAQITVSTSDPELWEGYDYYLTEKIKFIPSAWDYKHVKSNKIYWRLLDRIKKYTFTIQRESYLRHISLSNFFVNPKFRAALNESDVVISVGGHHFTTILSRDLVSNINFDAMAVLAKKKMICFSQSFGPFVFHNDRNRILTQELLSKCFLMPRENKSKDEIISFLGNDNNVFQTYESVLSLSKYIAYKPIESRDNVLGVAIYCTQRRSLEEKESYQKTIATFCNYAIDHNYSIRFFPMELKNTGPDDRNFIDEIIYKIANSNKCFVYDQDMETMEHLEQVSRCKIFLGHKTHSTIFALATGTPLIALAYHPKTIEFLQQFDLETCAIDDKDLSIRRLCDIFDLLTKHLEEVSQYEYSQSLKMAIKIEKDLSESINMLKQ